MHRFRKIMFIRSLFTRVQIEEQRQCLAMGSGGSVEYIYGAALGVVCSY